jgi:hypothetical protein
VLDSAKNRRWHIAADIPAYLTMLDNSRPLNLSLPALKGSNAGKLKFEKLQNSKFTNNDKVNYCGF